jgi:hypothetical protein
MKVWVVIAVSKEDIIGGDINILGVYTNEYVAEEVRDRIRMSKCVVKIVETNLDENFVN